MALDAFTSKTALLRRSRTLSMGKTRAPINDSDHLAERLFMSALFYLARADGTVIGKFNEEELRAKISAGDFSPGDQYLAEGGEWLRLSRFPGAQFPKEFSHAAPTSPCGNTQSVMKPILTAVL